MAAASYAQEYNFAKGGAATLAQRLACAVVDFALNTVTGEGSAVAGHAARMALATQAVLNPDTVAAQLLLAVIVVLGNAGNVAPTDADLKATVATVWNAACGNA